MFEIFYPSHCRICGLKSKNRNYFCKDCCVALAILDPRFRCPHCFNQAEGICLECIDDVEIKGFNTGYCWEGLDGVQRVIHQARLGRFSNLFAAILLVQHARLGWPEPDLIFPLPGRGEKGYIKKFSAQLGVVYHPWLRKRMGQIPQSLLPLAQRQKMPEGVLALRECDLKGKTILLVDDTVGTFETMKGACRLLRQKGAKRVDALVLARIFVEGEAISEEASLL